MKPLGLPVKTPFGFYYYETQKNEILSIKQELYEYLDCLIKKGEYEKDISNECTTHINELKELGYLSPSKIIGINHPQTDIIEKMLSRKLNMVTLQLTQMCKLPDFFYCVFCFVFRHFMDSIMALRCRFPMR